jgi:hypothetical protein
MVMRPVRYFFPIYQGLERAGAALTCRQDDFADNLSEEGMRTKASGTG